MRYLELFDGVAAHVRRQGVDVEFERGKAVGPEVISQARARSPVPIPSSLQELYAEVGDGFLFWWPPFDEDDEQEYEDDEDAPPFAMVEVPPLLKLAEGAARESQSKAPMRQWLAFHHEGNGDRFCLETTLDPAAV